MHPNILKIMDPKKRHESWPIYYESRHKGGIRLAPPILDLWWNHEVVRDLCRNMPQWTPEITSSWLCRCGFLANFLRNGDNGDKSDKSMKWKEVYTMCSNKLIWERLITILSGKYRWGDIGLKSKGFEIPLQEELCGFVWKYTLKSMAS